MSDYTLGIFSMLNFIVHIYIGTHTHRDRKTDHTHVHKGERQQTTKDK